MKPRGILIRENAETLTCSDCAGSLEGIDSFGSCEVPDYAATRTVMNRVGELYLALREKFGENVEIDVVDPRNEIYLIPVLLGDYRRYHPPLGVFLKTLFLGISPSSVIVNGRSIHVGDLPAPEILLEKIGSVLESSQPAEA